MRELGYWDTRQGSVVALLRPSCAEEFCRLFVDAPRCRYQNPSKVRGDCTVLVDAVDGLYFKKTRAWLFGGVGWFTMIWDESERSVVVHERLQRRWKTAGGLICELRSGFSFLSASVVE